MRLHPYLILPVLFILPACAQHRAPSLANRQPLYTTLEPNFPDIATLIATNEELVSFHAANDLALRHAEAGSAAERLAAVERLRNAAAETSPGATRLLRLAILDLVNRGDFSPAEQAARTRDLLARLSGDTIEFRRARIILLGDMNQRLPDDDNFAARKIAGECYVLAQAYYRLGLFNEASGCLQSANAWAGNDPRYLEAVQDSVDYFTKHLRLQLCVADQLARSPDDPKANTTKGVLMLVDNGDNKDAATYLAKSGQPEIQRLGCALTSAGDEATVLPAMMNAALDALPATSGDDQLFLIEILREQAYQIYSSHAADTAKEKIQQRLIKAKESHPTIETIAPSWVREGAPPHTFVLDNPRHSRFVYILDHSARLGDAFERLKQEAIHSSQSMVPFQMFNAILVSTTATPLFQKVQRASPDFKKEFAAKLQTFRAEGDNAGRLQPYQDAFEQALAMAADRIYFVTDGRFDPKLLAVLRNLNSSHTCHINTLLLLNQDVEVERRLKEIAAANGGTYKFLSLDLLNK